MRQANCEECDESFTGRCRSQRFCSERCRNTARARRYRERNREKVRVYGRQALALWRKRNPERSRELRRAHEGARRARKRGGTAQPVDAGDVFLRDGGRCHICKRCVSRKNFHLDHLIPLSKGGSHSTDNLAVAHPKCNLRRGDGRIPAQLRLAA